jgi:hypothetical protein
MLSLFEYGNSASVGFLYDGRYELTEAVVEEISTRDPDLSLTQHKKVWGSSVRFTLSGPFLGFVTLFRRAADRLLNALKEVPPREEGSTHSHSAVQAVFEASTFGIFAPEGATEVNEHLGEWAVRNHIMPQVGLPGVPRVLFCARPVAATAQKRDGSVIEPQLFSLAVLVHEHFHALVETAAGSNGLPPSKAIQLNDWSEASPVNEALAVWMECHIFRQLGPMICTPEQADAAQAAVWAYVRSGPYPGWPYRGAEQVEALYRREGIGGVRRLIHQLREDPASVRHGFDQLPTS